jgi:hypothetical protein
MNQLSLDYTPSPLKKNPLLRAALFSVSRDEGANVNPLGDSLTVRAAADSLTYCLFSRRFNNFVP